MNVNTEDIEQIEFVRRFLSSIRNEDFSKYKKDTELQYQAFSNVIGLLANKVKDLQKIKGEEL